MLRGQENWIPVKDSLALTLKVKLAKPETETENGHHKVSFGSHRYHGRSFCGRGADTNLAVHEQQKARLAFLGVGITSSKHQSLGSVIL
jgi:hypothetical protein